MDRQDILERLDKLDMEAFSTIDTPDIYQMIIVGGSGLVLLGTLSRATRDIDALEVSPQILHLLEAYDANVRVSAFENCFPYNFEDRLLELPVGGRKIRFYTASLEDIIIAKLHSNRDKDRQDIISDEVVRALDWKKLRELAYNEDETKASALNERAYLDFLSDYKDYVERYGPHEETDV